MLQISERGEDHTLDPARIYAAGHSNGGSMVYALWVARGDAFAALAPSASVFRADLSTSAKPKPALIVAGQKDQLVPFGPQRRSLDATLRLNRADETGTPWSGGGVLHKSSVGADVVAMMVRFFKEQRGKV